MTLLLAEQGRGKTVDIVIQDVNGATITPASADTLRAIIGRRGEAAQLTVVEGSPTANGSTFTKNTPSSGTNRLRLDAADLNFNPGTYTLFVDLLDNSDAQEWKSVDSQVFHLDDREGT
jgi:hypothetical protein